MTIQELIEKAKSRQACVPALEWLATQPDAQTAWDKCHNADWLEWYFRKFAPFEQWTEGERILFVARAENAETKGLAWKKYAFGTTAGTASEEFARYSVACRDANIALNEVTMKTIRRIMPNP